MRSAILLRIAARSAALVLPQAGAGAVRGVERELDVLGRRAGDLGEDLPVTGDGFSKYWPLTGGDVLAADDVVVAACTVTGLPGVPGAA